MERYNNLKDKVVLVDKDDNEIGLSPKLEAHQKGLLHRAFSLFVFNSKGELLLQKRAINKYHSGGLWSNTCCSHPFPEEMIMSAATRRLFEEMGMDCELHPVFNFIYKAELDNGLTEYEFDHVIFGISNSLPLINHDEVSDWKYISIENLILDMDNNPNNYTEWLKICLKKVISHIEYGELDIAS